VIDTENIRQAIHNALDALVAVDSGIITAGVTSPGSFTRTTGSFVTDGFVENSEVLVSGMASGVNGVWLVHKVTALKMEIRRLGDVAMSARAPVATARFRTVLPAARKFPGFKFENPSALRPWVRGTLKTQDSRRTTLAKPARVKSEGVYLLDLFYPLGYGMKAPAQMDLAIREALAPGTHLTYGGDTVSLMAINTAGEIEDESYVQLPITIKWWAFGWTLP